jgi:CMP-N,N'-diacetyllegionaminic acid synthase
MHVGLITARGGSKGVPKKNLADLSGKPLLAWTIEAAKKSRLDRIILSTDDMEIAQVGKLLGVEMPFLRPKSLASDSAKSIDVAIHAINELGLDNKDSLMILQPTNPFRSMDDINTAIDLLTDRKFDSAIGVTPVSSHHPERMLELVNEFLFRPEFVNVNEHLSRQELKRLFIRNGAIYHTNINMVKSGRFRGDYCAPVIMTDLNSINIDTQFDLEIARIVAANFSKFSSLV